MTLQDVGYKYNLLKGILKTVHLSINFPFTFFLNDLLRKHCSVRFSFEKVRKNNV